MEEQNPLKGGYFTLDESINDKVFSGFLVLEIADVEHKHPVQLVTTEAVPEVQKKVQEAILRGRKPVATFTKVLSSKEDDGVLVLYVEGLEAKYAF